MSICEARRFVLALSPENASHLYRMNLIEKYFPSLPDAQREQFATMLRMYPEWNSRINVISRRDIDNLEERHILHSLSIARFITPDAGTTFLDMGTGGGFPGIPLAALWPECRFHLIDRVGKKLTVAREIARECGLTNVTFQHGDMGECHERFDFVVSRAVMRLDALVPLIRRNIAPANRNGFPNGLICLKGGDIADEIRGVRRPVIEVPLSDYFNETFFDTKLLVYVDLSQSR